MGSISSESMDMTARHVFAYASTLVLVAAGLLVIVTPQALLLSAAATVLAAAFVVLALVRERTAVTASGMAQSASRKWAHRFARGTADALATRSQPLLSLSLRREAGHRAGLAVTALRGDGRGFGRRRGTETWRRLRTWRGADASSTHDDDVPTNTIMPSPSVSSTAAAAGTQTNTALGNASSCLSALVEHADQSWLDRLDPDPETELNVPNRESREVKSGHYVLVRPTPLPAPRKVIHSKDMASLLGLSDADCESEDFVRFFSGDCDVAGESGFRSWATPYALSIMGRELYENCPFGNGNGYGDGRAISVAEIVTDGGARWEMQLKGAGRTPFCRGADGRAVLRSSVREFLAMEAMHNMGVPTTRGLSLIVSGSAVVQRAWYDDDASGRDGGDDPRLPSLDDPRLSGYSMEMRQMLIAQLRAQLRNPDKIVFEQCAMTCRVAPSFLRVGHVELHARRATKAMGGLVGRRRGGDASRKALDALESIVEHALFREFSDVDDASKPIGDRVLLMMKECRERLTDMVSAWIRVGYCQGNFNSDNCLVGGRTMDYGPFGFIEKYDPTWNMWNGGGEHFSFMMQPGAARANFFSLSKAVAPLLAGDDARLARLQELVDEFSSVCDTKVNDVYRRKMGLVEWTDEAAAVYTDMERLMHKLEADYTIFWRRLADVAEIDEAPGSGSDTSGNKGDSDAHYVAALGDCFYACVSAAQRAELAAVLRRWRKLVGEGRGAEAATVMRAASPKYVPREWMLVNAYRAAQDGDNSLVHELHQLFRQPFDEQPDMEEKYFRLADRDSFNRGGTAFMT